MIPLSINVNMCYQKIKMYHPKDTIIPSILYLPRHNRRITIDFNHQDRICLQPQTNPIMINSMLDFLVPINSSNKTLPKSRLQAKLLRRWHLSFFKITPQVASKGMPPKRHPYWLLFGPLEKDTIESQKPQELLEDEHTLRNENKKYFHKNSDPVNKNVFK